MRIYLGVDRAGFEMKDLIKAHLEKTGHDVVDYGAHAYDPADNCPTFRIEAASRTITDPGSLGIALGGFGNGEQITANKVKGARCTLAWSMEIAKLAREHNSAQLIDLGGCMHSEEEVLAIVDAFISRPWNEEERHQYHTDILAEYKKTGVTSELPEA